MRDVLDDFMSTNNELYLYITMLIAGCVGFLVSLIIWSILLIPGFLYLLILATLKDIGLLWSKSVGRFFSK